MVTLEFLVNKCHKKTKTNNGLFQTCKFWPHAQSLMYNTADCRSMPQSSIIFLCAASPWSWQILFRNMDWNIVGLELFMVFSEHASPLLLKDECLLFKLYKQCWPAEVLSVITASLKHAENAILGSYASIIYLYMNSNPSITLLPRAISSIKSIEHISVYTIQKEYKI